MSFHDYDDRILKEQISILYILEEDMLNPLLKYVFLPALATCTPTPTLL